MKVLREKIKELQYWSFGSKAQPGIKYKRSIYNYVSSPLAYNVTLRYIGGILYNIYSNALVVLTKEE